ncbi:alpha/beta-hydrolase [Trichoderma chlorosporum]
MKSTLPLFSWLALAKGAAVYQQQLPTVDLGYQVHRAISFDETLEAYNFTNIPFAEPPLGSLRFSAPVPPKGRKSGIQDGSIGKVCPQASPDWLALSTLFVTAFAENQTSSFNVTQAKELLSQMPPPPPDGRNTEDCLVLDVLVPQKVFDRRAVHKRDGKGPKGAPVLVWIYGGGYILGDKTMNGTPDDLMAATKTKDNDGAIWVAMNYRLGAFGFLSGPTFLEQGGTANAGLLDQRLALDWVQQNIHLFGGDPDNVTVMGVSAGGGSIMHQITAYGGQEPVPFRRAIPQSAGLVPVPGNKKAEQAFDEFLALLNVTTLAEARALPSEQLLAANAKQVANAPYGTFVHGPTVDGSFVPGMPSKLILQGSFAKDIEILSTFNSNEGVLFTDPSAYGNDTLLKQQLDAIFTLMSSDDFEFLLGTLYPAKYDGSQPYTDSLGRAQLLIAEAALTCNQNSMVKAAQKQGVAAFGIQNSIWPATHGSEQPLIFAHGPTPGVDPQISTMVRDIIAGFVNSGSPTRSPGAGISIPAYGQNDSILNLVVNASSIIHDPTTNARCDWWQKALYY